jgi:alpha-L-fucosidase
MKKFRYVLAVAVVLGVRSLSFSQPLEPVEPVPTDAQLAWHEMEFNIFLHFGPNTFTDREWGTGRESENEFDPEHLDCEQWARIARTAGARGMIITAKHHDGFCLWPSATSRHTVARSGWKGGRGDVLRDLADACEVFDLKFGVYVSPWDRNHPAYGTPEYNDVFVNTMTEIFANYAPIFEFWWDGANGEGPDGKKQKYDFRRFENTVREISPKTLIFSDIGPDLRWVGNENGIAGETNWDLLDTAGFGRGAEGPPPAVLNRGNENGSLWIPAECDVSIRPGWFYHEEEDKAVKSPRELMAIYLASVGRGSTLLLNVPPGPDGLISAADSASLIGFAGLRKDFFAKNLAADAPAASDDTRDGFYVTGLTDGNPTNFWAARDDVKAPSAEVSLGPETRFNTIVLREYIALGQRVKGFLLEVSEAGTWKAVARGTTIGHKRIIQFPPVMGSKVRLTITGSRAAPAISELSVYSAEEYPVK